jgi:hypothetical protein
MTFIRFTEKNHKEHETFHFYLQWNGNEEALTLLQKIVDKSDDSEMYGDCSTFTMDSTKQFTEEEVNLFCKLPCSNDYHGMFTKCTGTFYCPFQMEDLLTDNTALLLDETFYPCKIERMFSEYRNYYEELLNGKITREEYERLSK